MKVTIYTRPDGRQRDIEVKNVRREDAEWFINNHVRISMEDIDGDYVVYADIGKETEDGEPDEVMVFSGGRTCEDTLADLRQQCEKELEQ